MTTVKQSETEIVEETSQEKQENAETNPPTANRQALEDRLKEWFQNWNKSSELPPAPPLPPDFSPHLTFMYEIFNKRIEKLDERLTAIYKLAFRTSAALLGLALPTLGPNAVTTILKALGIL